MEQYLLERFPGGLEYAFECVGSEQIMSTALKILAPNGRLALVGAPPAGTELRYPVELLLPGRSVVGGFLGCVDPEVGFGELVKMYGKNEGDFRALVDAAVTHRFRLEQINEAFGLLKSGGCIRSLIVFD